MTGVTISLISCREEMKRLFDPNPSRASFCMAKAASFDRNGEVMNPICSGAYSFNFDAAWLIASSHVTGTICPSFLTSGYLNLALEFTSAGIAKWPYMHKIPGSPGSSFLGETPIILLNFTSAAILQPIWHKMQAPDSFSRICHLVAWADRAPVGHTSMHDPQNSQPLSICG